MTERGFSKVRRWLEIERQTYQTVKFNYDEEARRTNESEYWIQQFDSYIQRLPVFGLETLQGTQAALKLAATAVALCEHLADAGELPKPGVSSGTIEPWDFV
jgi:hypothetical protein